MNHLLKEDINRIIKHTKKYFYSLSGKRLLLTGGNGFLGKYFIEIIKEHNKFLEKPVELIVFDNTFKKNSFSKKYNIRLVKKDVSKKFSYKKKLDVIVHAAGIASPFYYRKKPIETLEVAINGTINCLTLAKKHNSKFIFFSSSEIYGDPDKKNIPTKETYRGNVNSLGPRACYDESKRLGETLCYIYKNTYNLHTNIIRPFNIYGPGMNQNDYRLFPNFIGNILNNKKINIYGTGKQTRTYCYVSDAIEGFIKVISLGKAGEVYNIGNNKPEVSVKDIYKILEKINKNKIKSQYIKHPKSYPNDEPQRRCPDITKAKKHLNYEPKINLEKGLKFFLNWAKENYKY
tara:strand:+ start:1423 stop:2460 length:1038 start_codon:yes stop_codon:yes gene_type:complete